MDPFAVFSSTPKKEAPVVKTEEENESKAKDSHSRNSHDSPEAARVVKRVKKEMPSAAVPVVTDNYEVEATQILPAAKASIDAEAETSEASQVKHQVRHEVALPPNYDYTPISQHKIADPARTYPFVLDPFQALSVAAIDRQESVLVSAHTSAGKTVVAEYAIAQSLRAKQRVIYTSPIKALSNQKYRELLADFGDVGLMTGDVTINPEASCLVMTTEILRSMLYRGSEVMREVAWVIFDEIHYMRDKERGVVWEETIILLPDNVKYVFLSATIPNALEFAEWICKNHEQPCHVVYTNFRPTPLQHYLFPEGGTGIHLVVDEKGTFREENFQKAMSVLGTKNDDDIAAGNPQNRSNKKGPRPGETPDIYKIIKMIMVKNFNPVIIFSFSKRECETLAMKMSKVDFNNEDEHDMINKVFKNAISQLSAADQELPQIKSILPLLVRGIGVHHSGLLPILKEVIELLFQEGLLKVLFATETFSIGLNMPAKTVVFTNVRKFDGKEVRWVSGGEYIQMSGRAGRRGLDDRGIVIMMINEQMEPTVAKGMVKGVTDRLDSAFHLGYNMILNLLRVEGISPEFMLSRCFYQFQHVTKVPGLETERSLLEVEFEEFKVENESEIAEYYRMKEKITEYGEDMRKVITHPQNSMPFLQKGRLIYVRIDREDKEPLDFGWGIVANVARRRMPRYGTVDWTEHQKNIVEVILSVSQTTPIHLVRKGDPTLAPGIEPPVPGAQAKAEILPITLDSIVKISTVRVPMPNDINASKQRRALIKSVSEIQKRFDNNVPQLDPVKEMHIKDPQFDDITKKIKILEQKLHSSAANELENLETLYKQYCEKMDLGKQISQLNTKIQQAQSILQMDELKNRKRVLKKLDFTTPDDAVELKGRVACEISSGDELLITELIFDGTFAQLTPNQAAALLSCFVFDDRTTGAKALHPELREPFHRLQSVARKIARVSMECKLQVNERDYVDSFKPELMDVVFQWTKGATFAQICKMTDVFEGSLVRIFRRLEELIRQLVQAAKTIGNEELAEKMEAAINLIKRDMLNAASLYL